MANRRCFKALTRHTAALFSTNPSLKILTQTPSLSNLVPHKLLNSRLLPIFYDAGKTAWSSPSYCTRSFSSNREDHGNEDEGDEVSHSEEEDEGQEWEDGSDDENVAVPNGDRRETNVRDKEAEAAAIGYKVIGSLDKDDRVFKPYEPVFAVVQIGSHQFKVSNGDCIFTERLKFCEVNDKLILNKVLLLGSSSQTIVGRPNLPDAAVHAVVEEHALDAKVIIFKKKRRKNYRRTKGHRQELTKLRITDIQGIEKPENIVNDKPSKAAKKIEKVAIAS